MVTCLISLPTSAGFPEGHSGIHNRIESSVPHPRETVVIFSRTCGRPAPRPRPDGVQFHKPPTRTHTTGRELLPVHRRPRSPKPSGRPPRHSGGRQAPLRATSGRRPFQMQPGPQPPLRHSPMAQVRRLRHKTSGPPGRRRGPLFRCANRRLHDGRAHPIVHPGSCDARRRPAAHRHRANRP